MKRYIDIAPAGKARQILTRSPVWQFFTLCALTLALFWPSFWATVTLVKNDDRYAYAILAPAACAFLILWRRSEIFAPARHSLRVGVPLFCVSVLGGLVFTRELEGPALGGCLAIILTWLFSFVLCFGFESFRLALYPFSCLLFALPVSSKLLDQIAAWFQYGSAAVTYTILEFADVTVYREGTRFWIPHLNFEIAPECSGIRSGLFFLFWAIAVAGIGLRSPWRRLVLILSTVPITIFKNSVRIVATAWLGANVDRSFIDGPFHHEYGGIIFGGLDLVICFVLLALRRSEHRRLGKGNERAIAPLAIINPHHVEAR